MRLTGKHETQSIDEFSWRESDRGASIRVPLSVSEDWKGYLEDRRPASNADPYKVVRVIYETLAFAEVLDETNSIMYSKDDPNIITKVNPDFLKEYLDDDLFEMETELKRTGKFEEYARGLTTRGVRKHIEELEQFMLEIALTESNESFVTEAGDVEKWAGKGIDKEKIIAELQEYIQKLKEHIGD